MRTLGYEFDFFYKHFNSDVRNFEETVSHNKKKRILSVNNNSHIRFENFPNYKASHFIRDPRDLIVSGYRYHLWTPEKWCNDPNWKGWTVITDHPYFSEYIEKNRKKFPVNISYKEYLNKLDTERGLILELIRCQRMLSRVKQWDFNNSKIIEFKYEEIIGNEAECFRKIFSHYEFHPKLIERGVEIAERNSLKNKTKSETGHVRKGTPKQWASEFTPLIKDLFKKVNGDLLVDLGYEKDMEW